MRIILFSFLIFFALAINAQHDNQSHAVKINSEIHEGNLVLTFENKRPPTTIDKLNSFCQRIESLYSDALISVSFLRLENSFQVRLKEVEVSENLLEEIFVHFNIESYEIK